MDAEQISKVGALVKAGRDAEEILWDFLNQNKTKIFVDGLGHNSAKWTCIKKINFDDNCAPKSFCWEYDNGDDRDEVNFPTSAYLDLDAWVATQKAKREIKKRQEEINREQQERAQLERLQQKYK